MVRRPVSKASKQNEDILALRSLSSLQPRYPVQRSLAAIESIGPDESSRFLDSMRMRSLVARRLAAVPSPSKAVRECDAALAPAAAKARHRHDVLEANLKRLSQVATRLGLAFFGGKGISAHATYTDQSVRDFNDVDIFVQSHRDATALSRVLRNEIGYRYQKYELPWFKLDPSDGLIYGQIALVAPENDADLLNVDIHFGDYSVRHCGRLDLAGTFSAGSPGLHMIGPEKNLACIVNNAAGDYFVTAKDTNDLLMALSLPDFDIELFSETLRTARLDGFFGFIAETLRASAILDDEQERKLSRIPTPRTFEPTPRLDQPDWNRRCIGTAAHAFAVRRPAGLVPAVAGAAGAFSYYRKRLKLTVTRAGTRSGDKPVQYNRWTCVRLVPLSLAAQLADGPAGSGPPAPLAPSRSLVNGDPDFERFDTPAGTYFRIEDEVFLATVEYKLPLDLIRYATGRSTRP